MKNTFCGLLVFAALPGMVQASSFRCEKDALDAARALVRQGIVGTSEQGADLRVTISTLSHAQLNLAMGREVHEVVVDTDAQYSSPILRYRFTMQADGLAKGRCAVVKLDEVIL